MKIDKSFAGKTTRVEETPDPFRQSLEENLGSEEAVSLLVYSPVFKSAGRRFDATVVAMTDERWLILAEEESGRVRVSGAPFEDTLLVEMTEILLFGQLKIDFATEEKTFSSLVHFDLVEEEMYRETAHLILNNVAGISPATDSEAKRAAIEYLSEWPLKFRHGVLRSLPPGRQLLFATHWPAVVGGFRRELAPAAALALTKHEVYFVSDDKASRWFSRRRAPKYGYVVTYLPLVRLAQHRIHRETKNALLELETHAIHGGESLRIMLPLENESTVAECMDLISPIAA